MSRPTPEQPADDAPSPPSSMPSTVRARRASSWVRRQAGWRIRFHQGTTLNGRDEPNAAIGA